MFTQHISVLGVQVHISVVVMCYTNSSQWPSGLYPIANNELNGSWIDSWLTGFSQNANMGLRTRTQKCCTHFYTLIFVPLCNGGKKSCLCSNCTALLLLYCLFFYCCSAFSIRIQISMSNATTTPCPPSFIGGTTVQTQKLHTSLI